jgi:hypothetical protein
MWQERLDVFWDGDRALLLGVLDSGGDAARLKDAGPDLTIISSRNADFSGETIFVDRLDPTRWRAGACLVGTPPGHKFVALLAPDGAELRLSLEDGEESEPGEWRLALTLSPESLSAETPVIRSLSCPAQYDFPRFAREQFALAGTRLVWACGHRRLAVRGEDSKQLLRIWPASQLFPPTRIRLAAEGLDYPPDGFEDRRQAPFAVMEQWLREGGAPRPTLKLRLADPVDETVNVLSQISVALVMQQRRRLREWAREQREAGEPAVSTLSFEDIRQATGQIEEFPDAVWSHEPIVVYNLLKLVTAPEDAPLDGLTIRRSISNGALGAGMALELDFYGAALGDDIALVSLRPEPGEAWTLPRLPGNAPDIRLFRVEAEGVRPRRLAEDDPLAAELRRFVSEADGALGAFVPRATLERAASLQARREKFTQSLNASLGRLDYAGGFDGHAPWEPLTPLLLIAFVALMKQSEPAGRVLAARLGGYRGYRLDPSLFAALVLHPQWGEAAAGALKIPSPAALVYRFAEACGAEELLAPKASVADQARLFDRLIDTSDPRKLRAARLILDDQGNADPLVVAEKLSDFSALQQAAAFFQKQGASRSAEGLRDYLKHRAEGRFVSLTEAASLIGVLANYREAAAKAEQARMQEPAPEPASPEPAPPPPRPKGILATVRGFFGGGR